MKKVLLMTLALALTFSMSFNASADIYIGSESSEESNLNLLEEFDLSQYPEIAEKMKKQEKALTAYAPTLTKMRMDVIFIPKVMRENT